MPIERPKETQKWYRARNPHYEGWKGELLSAKGKSWKFNQQMENNITYNLQFCFWRTLSKRRWGSNWISLRDLILLRTKSKNDDISTEGRKNLRKGRANFGKGR